MADKLLLDRGAALVQPDYDEMNWNAVTVRYRIGAALIPQNGTKVRVAFQSALVKGLKLQDVTIGIKGAGAVDFATAPTAVTFNGGQSSFTIGAGAIQWSDEITLTVTTSDDLVIAAFVPSSTADCFRAKTGAGTNYGRGWKVGNDTTTQTTSGYTTSSGDTAIAALQVYTNDTDCLLLESGGCAFPDPNNNLGSFNGATVRQRIGSALIPQNGTKVRVAFASTYLEQLQIDACYIGLKGSGTLDFASAPTQVTFNGGSGGFTIGTNRVQWSDEITLSVTTSDSLVIAVHPNLATGDDFWGSTGNGTNYDYGFKFGVDETTTQTATGYTTVSGTLILNGLQIYTISNDFLLLEDRAATTLATGTFDKSPSITLSNGNLTFTPTAAYGQVRASQSANARRVVFELTITTLSGPLTSPAGSAIRIGYDKGELSFQYSDDVGAASVPGNYNGGNFNPGFNVLFNDDQWAINGGNYNQGASGLSGLVAVGDVFTLVLDRDASGGTASFYRTRSGTTTLIGSDTTMETSSLCAGPLDRAFVSARNNNAGVTCSFTVNFGATPFARDLDSGFVSYDNRPIALLPFITPSQSMLHMLMR